MIFAIAWLKRQIVHILEASISVKFLILQLPYTWKKVQVGKDQEKAQSEKDSHSKNQGGKKPN